MSMFPSNRPNFSRRSFLSAGLFSLATMAALSFGPRNAFADVASSSSPGARINPYSVSMAASRTLSEFTTSRFRVELRRGIYNGSYWLWVRSTVNSQSNYEWGSTVSLTTPYGSVSGLPYGSGTNLDVGAQRCTAAICIGIPTKAISVTYAGAAWGSHASKSYTILAEGIARAAQ